MIIRESNLRSFIGLNELISNNQLIVVVIGLLGLLHLEIRQLVLVQLVLQSSCHILTSCSSLGTRRLDHIPQQRQQQLQLPVHLLWL